jgi:Ca2+-binding RTX toxin-like protein
MGGGGEDAASYRTANRGVVADLSSPGANTGAAQGDEYAFIERLIGSDFNDELRGGFGDGVLFGRKGDDVLVGQFGTTRLVGGKGADQMIGFGVSTLAAYWDASSGVRVDLDRVSRNNGDAKGDTFDNINGVEGSDFRDRLFGDRRDNLLAGREGRDDLTGRSGNDRLNGGDGADKLSGGRGFDTAVYVDALRRVKVDLANANRKHRRRRRRQVLQHRRRRRLGPSTTT